MLPAAKVELPSFLEGLRLGLLHPHHRLRLAALEALEALAIARVDPALVVGSVAPVLQSLADDRVTTVRAAAVAAAAAWLRKCRVQQAAQGDTAASLATVEPLRRPLLCAVLLGVTDDSVQNSSAALQALVDHGAGVQALPVQPVSRTGRACCCRACFRCRWSMRPYVWVWVWGETWVSLGKQ